MQKLITKNKLIGTITKLFIALGQIVMLYYFLTAQKKFTWISYFQMVGIITGAFYAYGMFLNKAKIMGVCGLIFNVITALTLFNSQLWGLLAIRLYGVFMTLKLTIKGKDNYQSKVSLKSEFKKLLLIIIFATLMYIFNGIKVWNLWLISLDFSAVIILTIALFFHSKQSIKQYQFWFIANALNVIIAVIKGNKYLFVVFLFWWIMDNINWLNWKISASKKGEKYER